MLKHVGVCVANRKAVAAAFGRLCVETLLANWRIVKIPSQPPSGGCVLKLGFSEAELNNRLQPPSGGCVLKLGSK